MIASRWSICLVESRQAGVTHAFVFFNDFLYIHWRSIVSHLQKPEIKNEVCFYGQFDGRTLTANTYKSSYSSK